MTSRALDTQVGGGHYKNYAIQPIEFIVKNKLPFIEGAIIKYICRHREKNGVQDLEKIKHFVDLLIELEYKDEKHKGINKGPYEPWKSSESFKSYVLAEDEDTDWGFDERIWEGEVFQEDKIQGGGL